MNKTDQLSNRSVVYAVLGVRNTNWKTSDSACLTNFEALATDLWLDSVKRRILCSGSDEDLHIDIVRSSFVDLQNAIEFKITLLCKLNNSPIVYKIKIQGKSEKSSIGNSLDSILPGIVNEIISKLGAKYGRINYQRIDIEPKSVTRMVGDTQDLLTQNLNLASSNTPSNNLLTNKPTLQRNNLLTSQKQDQGQSLIDKPLSRDPKHPADAGNRYAKLAGI